MRSILWLKWLVLLILIGLVPVATGNSYLLRLLTLVGIYSLIVISFDLLVGYSGQFSLGVNGFFALGAYVTAISNVRGEVQPLVALLLGTITSGIAALILGYPCSRLKGYYLGMASLGFGLIVYGLLIALPDLTGGESGLIGLNALVIAGFKFSGAIPYFILTWLLILLMLGGFRRLIRSRHGRAILALSQDEIAAKSLGINVQFYRVTVFAMCGFFAGLAGGIYAFYQGYVVPADFGIVMSIDLLLMLFLGGQRSLWGGIIGVFLLKFLPDYLGGLGDFKVMIYGMIFILVLVFMPMGIAPVIEKGITAFSRIKTSRGLRSHQ